MQRPPFIPHSLHSMHSPEGECASKVHYESPNKIVLTYYETESESALQEHFKRSLSKEPYGNLPKRRRVPASFWSRHARPALQPGRPPQQPQLQQSTIATSVPGQQFGVPGPSGFRVPQPPPPVRQEPLPSSAFGSPFGRPSAAVNPHGNWPYPPQTQSWASSGVSGRLGPLNQTPNTYTSLGPPQNSAPTGPSYGSLLQGLANRFGPPQNQYNTPQIIGGPPPPLGGPFHPQNSGMDPLQPPPLPGSILQPPSYGFGAGFDPGPTGQETGLLPPASSWASFM